MPRRRASQNTGCGCGPGCLIELLFMPAIMVWNGMVFLVNVTRSGPLGWLAFAVVCLLVWFLFG